MTDPLTYHGGDPFDAIQDARAEHALETGEPISLRDAVRSFLADEGPFPGQEIPTAPARSDYSRAGAPGPVRCPAPANRAARHAPAVRSPYGGPPCTGAAGANGASDSTNPE